LIETSKAHSKENVYKAFLGFCWFFLLLFSYYILRPIREQIGSLGGTENLSLLFWLALMAMLICIPVFSFLVSKLHRRLLVPVVYGAFIFLLVFFRLRMSTGEASTQVWLGRGFFVFVSVYGIFLVSFFWSVIGDMISRKQSGRLFGVIAAGGTLGGITGSQSARLFVENLGVENLLLLPAVALGLAVVVFLVLEAVHTRHTLSAKQGLRHTSQEGQGTGGNPFAGFRDVLQSPFLLQVAGFILLMGACSTAVYFAQAEIVKEHFAGELTGAVDGGSAKAAATKYFATINLCVSFVTVFLQFIVFRFLYTSFGITLCLLVLPFMYVLGLLALGLSPSIEVLSVVAVLGRSCEYGIFNPSKESLFTSVTRSKRYKAKSFIDTVIRRSGDSVVGSIYRSLRGALMIPGYCIVLGTIPIAGVMAYLGYRVAKKSEQLNQSN
jgi:AAA family ATP:ADP antiporter